MKLIPDLFFPLTQARISHGEKKCLVQSLAFSIYCGVPFPGQSVILTALNSVFMGGASKSDRIGNIRDSL